MVWEVPGVDGHEAASGRGELVVSVGADGVLLGVRLSPAVMELPAEELASRVVRLNTLAYLHCQLAIDQGTRGDRTDRRVFPSAAQVAAYARTSDF
jgi:hypothetical protein